MSEMWSYFEMFHLIDEARRDVPEAESKRKKQLDIEDFETRRHANAPRKGDQKVGTSIGDPNKIAQEGGAADQIKHWKAVAKRQWVDRINAEKAQQGGGDAYQVPEGEIDIWDDTKDTQKGSSPAEKLFELFGVSGGRLGKEKSSSQLAKIHGLIANITGQKRMKDPSWTRYQEKFKGLHGGPWMAEMMKDPAFRKLSRKWDEEYFGKRGKGEMAHLGLSGKSMDEFEALNQWADRSGYDTQEFQDLSKADPTYPEIEGVLRNLSRGGSQHIGEEGIEKKKLAHSMLRNLNDMWRQDKTNTKLDAIKELAAYGDFNKKEHYPWAHKRMMKILDSLSQVPWDDDTEGYTAAPRIEPHPEDPRKFQVYRGADATIANIEDPDEREKALANFDAEASPTSVGVKKSSRQGARPQEGEASTMEPTSMGQREKALGFGDEERGKEQLAMPNDEELKGLEKQFYDFFSGEAMEIMKGMEANPKGEDWSQRSSAAAQEMEGIIGKINQAAKSFHDRMPSKAKMVRQSAKSLQFKLDEFMDFLKAMGVTPAAPQAQPQAPVAQQAPQAPVAAPQAPAAAAPVAPPTTSGAQIVPKETPAKKIPKNRDFSGILGDHTEEDLEALIKLRESFNDLVAKLDQTKPEPKRNKSWLKKANEWLKAN